MNNDATEPSPTVTRGRTGNKACVWGSSGVAAMPQCHGPHTGDPGH